MFTKVLIANRGEIAVRIERTLSKMGIGSVAVYSEADQDSLHVSNADEAVCLGSGSVAETYLDTGKIIAAAVEKGAQAIHPGYGFMSESSEFAKKCAENGIVFIGPTPEQLSLFGLKHTARECAEKAGIPLLKGSGILSGVEDAVKKAGETGYPVMLKSTAGGGGIGMRVFRSEDELRNAYDAVEHLAEKNFGNGGLFIEKYVEHARHIEVQIFGSDKGVIAIGERDCSVQRRNQKVVEECPAPGISDRVREQLRTAAVRLAESVGYRNAGTVEFIYDDLNSGFYFLEVNTRLQVEHGITEEVYGVDIVEWMLREAANEFRLPDISAMHPDGHAIEMRIYAEDCYNSFRPSTGKIDDVIFEESDRVDTWIRKNIEVTSLYDSMLAKLIVHGKDRNDAVRKALRSLDDTRIYGITTNVRYLRKFIGTDAYKCGKLSTHMLDDFCPEENVIEVIDGGIQTTVQDYPGRTGYWMVGVPPCGPFDMYSFRIGNSLLGNESSAPGLEMTITGGKYKFHCEASFCITGADMNPTLNGKPISMYMVVTADAGDELDFDTCDTGMRSYMLVRGGLDVPKVMGSASTFIDGRFGGHSGRTLRTGDMLGLSDNCSAAEGAEVPENCRPSIGHDWEIRIIPGPQPTAEYLKPEYLHTLTTSVYEVNYDSARTGIRLNGPIPEWSREDGGEAGLHPSNIHDNAYSVGALDLTGDQTIILGPDGPSLGGFVCSAVTAKSDQWKLGQLHAGDHVRFRLITLGQAEYLRREEKRAIGLKGSYPDSIPAGPVPDASYAILKKGTAAETEIMIRLSGEDAVLVEYGEMELNIELRFRVHILMKELEKSSIPIKELTPGIRSLQVCFDCEKTDAFKVAETIMKINALLPELDDIKVRSRIVRLPLSWDDPQTVLAAKRYQETTRHDAPWCPSNPEFIRRINGLDSVEDVENVVFNASYLVLGLGDVYLGAPVATPVDPRQRLVTTKYNPARPWTPENAVGIGGAYLCVYGMEGPGGYQFVGRTIQMWNQLTETPEFRKGKPWLLNFFDQIRFYPVSADEILKMRNDFLRGRFRIDIEESEFCLKDYKKFLTDNADTINEFKCHQVASFNAEKQRWKEKGLDHFDSVTPVAGIKKDVVPDGCDVVKTDLAGAVWKVLVSRGESVTKGQELAVLESMKMEYPVYSSCEGIVEDIYINSGELVSSGQNVVAVKSRRKGINGTGSEMRTSCNRHAAVW